MVFRACWTLTLRGPALKAALTAKKPERKSPGRGAGVGGGAEELPSTFTRRSPSQDKVCTLKKPRLPNNTLRLMEKPPNFCTQGWVSPQQSWLCYKRRSLHASHTQTRDLIQSLAKLVEGKKD